MDCKTAQSMITAYVQRQLDDKQLEEFLTHIGTCQECHEELEIFFTIHFALQGLDEDKDISYNIQQKLRDDLEMTERRVHRRKHIRIVNYVVMLLAEVVLAIVLLMQVEIWNSGSFEDTMVFRLMYGELIETETTVETETKALVTIKEEQQDGVKDEQEDEREVSIN